MLLNPETRLPKPPPALQTCTATRAAASKAPAAVPPRYATALNTAALGACPDDQMALLPEDEAPREAATAAAAAATRTSTSVTARTQQHEQLRDALQLLASPPILQSTCEPGRGGRP